MRRTVVMGIVLVGLALMAASSAWGCHFLNNACGRCRMPCGPCGHVVYCAPCWCVPAYCVPVICEPVCCEPAAPSKATSKPAGPAPMLAPPKSSKQPAPPAQKPEKTPAVETPTTPGPPAELPGVTQTPAAPKPAVGPQLPAQRPAAPSQREARPVEKLPGPPPEKPLVARYDNPFIIETDQLQIWTDSTGDHRVEARFVSFDGKTVRLKKANGQYMRVGYERLSVADRQRVRDLSHALAMKMSMK